MAPVIDPPQLTGTVTAAAIIGAIMIFLAAWLIAAGFMDACGNRFPLARYLAVMFAVAVVIAAVVVGIALAYYNLKWADYNRSFR